MSEEPLNIDLTNIPPDRLAHAVSLVAKQKYACKDCGVKFVLSEGEILYFLEQTIFPSDAPGAGKNQLLPNPRPNP